ncbi:VOC family protein [Bradyrhizobium sp. LTSPM299]|uniref:VOC family protein n=1 Tax=Bradyrhizobium sp. LTSPM299 TaxID=1619233 RepID=UPI000679C1EE|nr:VOC family protein [Bradyrhizobium sp. LTSPM299]
MDRSANDIAPTSAALAFHHLGLAVASPEDAFRYLASLGYTAGNAAFDPIQRVNLAMRHHLLMPDVEVIWPGDGPSPIDKLIKRNGTMIYHLCYACPDAEQALAALSASGVEIMPVSAPAPAILFGGQKVSFHLVSGFGLIELLETGIEP